VRPKIKFPLLILLLLAGLLPAHARAQSNAAGEAHDKPPKFIMFIMDRVSWRDYVTADAPALRKIISDGALGLMVAHTAGSRTNGGYLTIGASALLRSDSASLLPTDIEGYAFPAEAKTPLGPARQAYRWLTNNAPGEAEILHLGISNFLAANSELKYTALPGLLGQTLRDNKIIISCIGNSDLLEQPYRPAVAIAMDREGKVAFGDLSPSPPASDKGIYHTSNAALLRAFKNQLKKADFIVVDFGDSSRIGRCEDLLTWDLINRHLAETVKSADAFLAAMLENLKGEDFQLLIATPHLKIEPDVPNSFLAPIIFYGPKVQKGWLTSASTRSRAVVANTDIAPSILAFYKLQTPAGMIGSPINIIPVEDKKTAPLSWILDEDAHRARIEPQRTLLLVPAAIMMIAIFLACMLSMLLANKLSVAGAGRKPLGYLCLFIICWPLMMLLLGWEIPATTLGSCGVIAAGGALLVLLARQLSPGRTPPFILICMLFCLICALDLIFGQRLMQYSPLSYAPSLGARFYGIGNYLSGAFVGAFLVAFSGLWQKTSRPARMLQWLLMAAAIVILGHNSLGADFGMSLAITVACGYLALLMLRDKTFAKWAWVLSLLLVFVVLIGSTFFLKDSPSHISRAAQQINQDASRSVYYADLITRKLEANWRLLRYSVWAEVMWAGLALIALLYFRTRTSALELFAHRPGLKIAFKASLVGALAAFIFNDSGTVAAALCLIYPAAGMAFLVLTEQGSDNPSVLSRGT